jgi:hypothetical protein
MGNVNGLSFDPPAGFDVSEVMVTLRGPDTSALKESRALQPQFPVRPNLIVHRRARPEGAELDVLAAELCAELLTTIDGLKDLKTEEVTLADDVAGRLVSFDFPAGKAMTVRQFQVVRLDDQALWTMTLTIDSAVLTDDVWAAYERSLLSLGT